MTAPLKPFQQKCPQCGSANIKCKTFAEPPDTEKYVCCNCRHIFAAAPLPVPECDLLTVSATAVGKRTTDCAVICLPKEDGVYSLCDCAPPLNRFCQIELRDDRFILNGEEFSAWRQPLRIVKTFAKDGHCERVTITVTWEE